MTTESKLHLRFLQVLVLGTAIRLALAPFTGHASDLYEWYNVFTKFTNGINPYVGNSPFVYPPAWFYTLMPFANLHAYIASITGISPLPASMFFDFAIFPVPIIVDWLFALMIKLPLITFDLLLSIVLYTFVKRQTNNLKTALYAGSILYLNPYSIFISAVWGMFDVIPAFFSLIAFILITKEDFNKAGICLGLSITYKYYASLLVIPSLLYIQKRGGFKKCLNFLLSIASIICLLSLPLLLWDASTFFHGISFPLRTKMAPNLSVLFFLRAFWPSELPQAVIMLNDILTIGFMSLIYIAIYKTRFSSPPNNLDLNEAFLLSITGFYLVFRQINEPYIVWILPFIMISRVLSQKKSYTYMLWILSSIGLLFSLSNIFFVSYFTPLLTIDPNLIGIVRAIPGGYNVYAQLFFGLFFWVIMAIAATNSIKEGHYHAYIDLKLSQLASAIWR